MVHVLAERGTLAYDHRVADVWPEFGAYGKDVVTLADVLVHAAGVPGLWPEITPADLGDAGRICSFIAGHRPWWTPGTMTGYHALTFGFIVDELVRRATGRTLAEQLRIQIAEPLQVADELHFGVPGHLLARVARAGPLTPVFTTCSTTGSATISRSPRPCWSCTTCQSLCSGCSH